MLAFPFLMFLATKQFIFTYKLKTPLKVTVYGTGREEVAIKS